MRRVWAFVILVLAGLVFAAWASDFVTMQGERTIYTVECSDGAWKDDRCSGKLVAGNRYRYRALKPHHEVIFWTVGSKNPSGKFDECTITDGRNWVCKANEDAKRSITLVMANGVPASRDDAVTRPFRAVSKWRWLLLEGGMARDATVHHASAPAPSG